MSGRERPDRNRRAELSQHFLRDASAARLVRATSITQADFVIEIGPGRGALTKPLLKRAGSVVVVELDEYLANELESKFGNQAQIIHGDFLSYALPVEDYIVVGNLPYSKSTEIIRKIVETPYPPRDAWIVVQRELANRMCGPPFSRESQWSLRLKPVWYLEILDRPRRVEFDPPPAVESVFLRMSHRGRSLVAQSELPHYYELIERSFRSNAPVSRTLRSILSKRQIRRLATDLRFNANELPNALTFDQWLGIFRITRKSR